MSAAPNQLAEIHRQLTEQFSSHQAISVVPVKGDPPDRYEIIFNIKGLSKTEKGDVVEATGHVVELSIPFGFPHFPPSCKPKSDIFHPDFDPAAICLGDFWHQDCDLPALVVYIGRMINGEFYSRSNAFNEEACIWYRNHPEALPLTGVEWSEDEETRHDRKIQEATIDTLDENDLSMAFDFLAIEEPKEEDGISQEGSPPAAEPAPTVDLDLLNLLEKQLRFYTLRDKIQHSGAVTLSEELHNLSLRSEEATARAEELFREARKNEKRGDLRSALDALEKIAAAVADFPELEGHQSRLRQTLAGQESKGNDSESMLSMAGQISGKDKGSTKSAGKNGMESPAAAKKTSAKTRWNKRIGGFLAGGIAAALSAGCGYYYWMGTAKLDTAASAFAKCTDLLAKDQFQEAEQSCREAQAISDAIKVLHQQRRGQLQAQIDEALQSEKMNQGLKGFILVEGRYLSRKDAEMLETFRRLHREAEDLFIQEKWQPAIERYGQILAMPEMPQSVQDVDAAEIKAKHAVAQFRLAYDGARQALRDGKWQQATTALHKAQGLLAPLPEDGRQQYATELRNALAQSSFEQSREQGEQFFANSEWQKAMAAYDLALVTPGIESLPKESLEEVHKNLKRAALYDLIDQGLKASGAGAWDEAIGDYRQAEEFLANHKTHLNLTDSEKSIRKLSRIILQALIVRDRQRAADHLQKEELVAAGDIYRQLMKQIDNSPFANEDEFLTAGKELAATVQALDEKIFLAEKSRYLENEYRKLFAANYPAAVVENLVNPVISFTKDTGGKSVFKMQCTETGGGRPLTLVMYYAYDRIKDQWELHSDQQ